MWEAQVEHREGGICLRFAWLSLSHPCYPSLLKPIKVGYRETLVRYLPSGGP